MTIICEVFIKVEIFLKHLPDSFDFPFSLYTKPLSLFHLSTWDLLLVFLSFLSL